MSKRLNDIKAENKALQEQNALLARRAGLTEDALDDSREFSNVLKDQAKQIKFQVSERQEILNITTGINKIAKESFAIQGKDLGLQKTNLSIQKNIESLEKKIIGLKSLKGKIDTGNAELNRDINESIAGSVKSTEQLIKELQDTQKISAQIADDLGVKTFGGISDIVGMIPGLNKFQKPFQIAEQAALNHNQTQMTMFKTGKGLTEEKIKELGLTEKLTITNKKGDKQLLTGRSAGNKLLKEGVKLQGGFTAGLKAAVASYLGPAGLLTLSTAAFKTSLEIEKSTVQLARNLGLSKKAAGEFKKEMIMANMNFDPLSASLNEQKKAVGELNNALGGTALMFSKDIRQGAFENLDIIGLSAEANAGLTKEMLQQGVSMKEIRTQAAEQVTATEKEFGIRLSLSSVLEEAGKLTGQARINIQAMPGGLAKAVATAKSLGIEMNTVANAAGQMLDFESSIAAEMEAELLIGRDLNLDRARAAALSGDQATLMQELVREAGSLEQLQSMNVIQQDALAAALGMSSDELANTLDMNATLNTQKEEGLDRDAAQLEASLTMLTTMEKLSRMFTKIGDIMKYSLPLMMGIAAAAAGAAIAMTLGVAAAPIAIGMGIVGAGLGAMMASVEDGVADPSRGPFTITDSFGATAITARGDGLAVSPNIEMGGSADAEARKTNRLLERILAKEGNVQIDGTNAGTAFAMTGYRIQ